MAKLSPSEFAEKWGRKLSSSTVDIERGVNRVTVNPAEKAAAQKTKMLNNLTEAVNNGKWEAGLRRVTLTSWKQDVIEKGIPNISRGIQRATPKVQSFASQLLPYQDNLKAEVDNMPDLTFEDSLRRVDKWLRGMREFKRS